MKREGKKRKIHRRGAEGAEKGVKRDEKRRSFFHEAQAIDLPGHGAAFACMVPALARTGPVRYPRRTAVFGRIVSPGDVFTLSYTHSVKLKPVWDFYTIGEHYEIMQNKTIFPDSDYGLPSRAVGTETYTLLPDGNGCISGMRRLIPSLLLRVERAYNNTFTFNDRLTLDLPRKAGDCVIDMHMTRVSLFQYAFEVFNSYGK